ncbi:MAG: type II secretion system F family protein [Armatimonadota bacterium]|nr:type II secretion system F family protein [Armatimonadota bacterium]
MAQIVIAVVVFILVTLFGLLIAELTLGKSVQVRRRLEQYSSSPASFRAKSQSGPADKLPTISRFLSSRGFTEGIILEISRAGLKLRPSEFAVITASLVVVLALIGILMNRGLVAPLVLGLLGYALPIGYLKFRQQRRLAGFNDQIADALSLMASSLRSGYSFMRAMQVVSNEMPAPISEEFGRVIDECNVGVPTEDALTHLVDRVRSYDMELVVTAVTIQIQLGGNLAEVLDTIAETIRERVRINGEVAALTADGRLSGGILVALPIVLGIVIYMLNPRYLSPLINESIGHYLLLGAGILVIIGALVIRKMLELDF